MDDVLEKPQATATNAAPYDDEADQSSEDEDGGLDWTKLLPYVRASVASGSVSSY